MKLVDSIIILLAPQILMPTFLHALSSVEAPQRRILLTTVTAATKETATRPAAEAQEHIMTKAAH